ncbi:MAG: NAD-dependent epimerase/dehydratase family protein [Kiritimatiellaeota bacterium]|nr:NAD-dependent epimerase/dehydratase family protein [Kiritimatiellota bacterium]
MAAYLITGGCGFIGSHIAEALVAEGHAVRVFDNLATGCLENLGGFADRVEFVRGDIRDPAALQAALRGIEFVFHEAALVSVAISVKDPEENDAINIRGTLNVLQAARAAGAKRVVLASSAAIYGNNPDLPKREEMLPEPESPYALGKLAGEHYLRLFRSLYGLQTVVLRYFNVFGPRQDARSMYSGVISKFAADLQAGRTPTIFGDGGQTRDFVFVKDVVQANLLAMRSDRVGRGETFNVATHTPCTLLDLLALLQKLTGRSGPPRFEAERAGDIRHSCADISKAQRVLGYQPQFRLEDGLCALLAAG